jgi:nucleoside-diphosphate-sugar epimerase
VKTVLITGASGFIGASLARRLLRDGHGVHLIVRPGYQAWRLDEIAIDVHWHRADLQDREAVQSAVGAIRAEWIFDLAAYGAYSSQTDPVRMIDTNIQGCVSLLDACVEAGFEAFIHAGSSSEYGRKNHAAIEDEALEPNSVYAVTKAAATHYCQYAARSRDVNAITVRLYSVYGPYEEPTRLVPTLIVSGLQGLFPPLVGPHTARDFVYVDDAVDAMVKLAEAQSIPRGEVYNVASGIQTTLAEIVDVSRKLTGVATEPVWGTMQQRSWDTEVWVGSAAKIERTIGWHARIGLESGLRRTLEWVQADTERLAFYKNRLGLL